MRAAPADHLDAEATCASGLPRETALLESPPLSGGHGLLGITDANDIDVGRRAMLVVFVSWVPLVALTIVQGAWTGPDVVKSMFVEVGVHARYLIAAPLLVLAVAWCMPQLTTILRYFINSGIVADRDRERFDAAVRSTNRLLHSRAAWLVAIALAYGLSLATMSSHAIDQVPLWARPVADIPRYSPAGWWHILISLPLLLGLILSWIWRLALWTRLLWLIARLTLRLVPSHPDRCAGLSFLGHSISAFAIVAFALAAILAGRSAHLVLAGSALPTPALLFNVGAVVAVGALFVAPLLIYSPQLVRVRQSGVSSYDAFVHRTGETFERKWLSAKADANVLDAPDASALADLSAVVANVHAVRLIPVGLRDLSTVAIAMLLPFVPVVLLAFPAEVIWTQIKGLLL